jgi:hypothetical protein
MKLGTYTNRMKTDWNPQLYSKADASNRKWTLGGAKRKPKRTRRAKPAKRCGYLPWSF